MIKLLIICTYCGKEYEETFYSKHAASIAKCKYCKSSITSAKTVEDANKDIFGYSYSPPFPKPKEEKEESLEVYKDPYWDYSSPND